MKLFNIEGKCLYEAGVSSIKELVEIAPIEDINLSWANLSGVNLSKVDLSGAYLVGATLSWANLSDTDLSYANLRRVDFSDANLRRVDFSEADLSRTNFNRAYLSGASLRVADLSGANLTGAILSYASTNVIGDGVHIKNIPIEDRTYGIAYTSEILAIGREHHTVDEWERFSDRDIISMDGKKALEYWKANKKFILNWVKEHPAKSTKTEED